MRFKNLNQQALTICNRIENMASQLDVIVSETSNGASIFDFGSDRLGTLNGGLELARICLANLADVSIHPYSNPDFNYPLVQVVTDFPLEACIASQYAGWPFSTEHLFSMCSGPARLSRGKEEILTKFDLNSKEDVALGIFETNQTPSAEDVEEFASQCNVQPAGVTICVAKTASLPGTMQVVARSVETLLHKLFELEFDLRKCRRAIGTAPLPPIGKDDFQSMGWTNDAILYGANVTLWVDDADDLDELMVKLPSCSSDEFGKPFIEIFESFNRDFYQVDRLLFSPACVTINCLATGKSVSAGAIRPDILAASFKS